jgi:hypothetical protein
MNKILVQEIQKGARRSLSAQLDSFNTNMAWKNELAQVKYSARYQTASANVERSREMLEKLLAITINQNGVAEKIAEKISRHFAKGGRNFYVMLTENVAFSIGRGQKTLHFFITLDHACYWRDRVKRGQCMEVKERRSLGILLLVRGEEGLNHISAEDLNYFLLAKPEH